MNLFFRRLVNAPDEQKEISVLSASRWDVSALCALSTKRPINSGSISFSRNHHFSFFHVVLKCFSLLGDHHFEIKSQVFHFIIFQHFKNVFHSCHFSCFPIHLSTVAVCLSRLLVCVSSSFCLSSCLMAHRGSGSHIHLCPRPCSSTYRWAGLPPHRHKGPHLCAVCALTPPFGRVTAASVSSPRDWPVSIGSHMQPSTSRRTVSCACDRPHQ